MPFILDAVVLFPVAKHARVRQANHLHGLPIQRMGHMSVGGFKTIDFWDGWRYQYYNFPLNIWAAMLAAPHNMGRLFNLNVRNNPTIGYVKDVNVHGAYFITWEYQDPRALQLP